MMMPIKIHFVSWDINDQMYPNVIAELLLAIINKTWVQT